MRKIYLALIVAAAIITYSGCKKNEETRKYYAFEGIVTLHVTDTANSIDTVYNTNNAVVSISTAPNMNNVIEKLIPVNYGFYTTMLEAGTYYVKVEAVHTDYDLSYNILEYSPETSIDTVHIFMDTERNYMPYSYK